MVVCVFCGITLKLSKSNIENNKYYFCTQRCYEKFKNKMIKDSQLKLSKFGFDERKLICLHINTRLIEFGLKECIDCGTVLRE